MRAYIHELTDWPRLTWNASPLTKPLAKARLKQGLLIGQMEGLGFNVREETVRRALTQEIVKSSEIEGERLDPVQVGSSIARRLGIDVGGLAPIDRHVEGIVELMLDATRQYNKPLTEERLFSWHAALFPTGLSGLHRITVGAWRTDSAGPMQVVSGPIGRQRVHYEAPAAARVRQDMRTFLEWFNGDDTTEAVLKAAQAHFWFVMIHPFDDGNGRIARAIGEMALARSEDSPERFYSMSARIRQERNDYYAILQATQTTDITPWMEWFLGCLERAIDDARGTLAAVLAKARFWEKLRDEPLNERQQRVINRLLDGFEGKLTTSKWAALAKCSQDTASRDIQQLVDRGILQRDPAGGRSTSYSLVTLVAS